MRTTSKYWNLISNEKHPSMLGKMELVQETLQNPDMIRRSKSDASAYLFYKKLREKRWIAVVAKHNGGDFVITCYITDRIKEGEEVWKK